MKNTIKYIFKEMKEPEQYDIGIMLDNGMYNIDSGDYNNTVFIMRYERGSVYGMNKEAYFDVYEQVNNLFNDFEYAEEHTKGYSYKQAMQENGIKYNPTLCGKLKRFYQEQITNFYIGAFDCIAEYLTLTTGHKWETFQIYGYCQGDYADIIYCTDNYTESDIDTIGDIYIGRCKEFSFTELDINGEEETVYGFFVADCQAWKPEQYKTLLCSWQGIKPEETALKMID